MHDVEHAIARYVAETRKLNALPTSTEATFYPDIKALLAATLKAERLPFEVITGTSEAREKGRHMPDFVLGDASLFVGVYGEVKLADQSLADIAVSTERNDQIGRYLAQTGVVLLCNIRGFGLLTCDPRYVRDAQSPVPPSSRVLEKTVDLWSAVSGTAARAKVDPQAAADICSIVVRAVTDLARIAAPADLAQILARQAHDAKDALPDDLKPLKPLLDDYRQALGLSFDIEDEKGARFFRSSLVQSVFYALFAAWVLWDKEAAEDAIFEIEDAHQYLPIPFLDALLHDIRHPSRMKHLGLEAHLTRAIATLNRVDRKLFRSRMTFPTVDGDTTVAAITYFYEPFLKAFDPQLRDELGVWYTPPEIVRYQVRRIHYLLKENLDRPQGLADPDVVILDPCCGTGAYLLETARCIADELKKTGDEATLGLELSKAFSERVIGFEILTAPFAIAQLQLYLVLDQLKARPDPGYRLAIFLTNALSGWRDPGDFKLNFPEMRDEFDASQKVKQTAKIIVVLGNPPYDRFTGAAQAEEAELVAHYKGIELVNEIDRKTKQVKRNEFGQPQKKQKGESLLYKEFGVRKQLLDDLYVRFFRLAEERIGEAAEYGIVSYISNSSYLTGRSHPLMRRSLLANFNEVWLDNLNGDKYRTGKIIPAGLPGEGTRDDSAFTTEADPRGIQPGTAISTWLKRRNAKSGPGETVVHYRDFWGAARNKRGGLLASLPTGSPPQGSDLPFYEPVTPAPDNRWRLSSVDYEGGYESWPALDEVFPSAFQAVNPSRGLTGTAVDTSRDKLRSRMIDYFSAESFGDIQTTHPAFAIERANYKPELVWQDMKQLGFEDERILPYLTFPFDQRWIYYSQHAHFLDRHSPEFARNRSCNDFLITVPEPRKVSEAAPVFASTLVGLHVHERGSVVFPRETRGDDLLSDRDANIPEPTWRNMRTHFGMSGERRDQDARDFVGRLFRVAFAVLHAPRYQSEHKSALSADWAHLPIPRDHNLLDRLAAAGAQVTALLDAQSDAGDLVAGILGAELARHVGPLKRAGAEQVRAGDLHVTVTYWGGGKGRWKPRPFNTDETPPDDWADRWGERTGDLFINDTACFANVPEAVWNYQLGGYPVIKKWLGYRQANRSDGAPLSLDESKWLRQVIQRIAALLALGPALDALYEETAAAAFTAEELGIDR